MLSRQNYQSPVVYWLSYQVRKPTAINKFCVVLSEMAALWIMTCERSIEWV